MLSRYPLLRLKMAKDLADSTTDEETTSIPETSNLSGSKKVKRGKAPKRILKSEREKLKREQLNDLFNNLACIVALVEPNNGKACVLGETIRLVSDIDSQIKTLREQNQALLSESDYMTAEKNELEDENSTLKAQIEQIQKEIAEKKALQSNSQFSMIPPEYWEQVKVPMPMNIHKDHTSSLAQFPPQIDSSLQQQSPIVGPLYMIPMGRTENQAEPIEPDSLASKLPSYVSKPHPRYPSPGDSWPLQLIQKQGD